MQSKALTSRVTRVGTSTPVADFKFLADKLYNQADFTVADPDEFEDLCLQLQTLIGDLFRESLRQASDAGVLRVFQEKVAACIGVLREYCSKLGQAHVFNVYIKAFKKYLVNESTANR